MHIPDGYLSPEACLAMYGAALPFWYRAGKHLKRALASRATPVLAVFAAFSFTVQMFNIPVPGGTSAHATGGTLIAIALGPAAAIVAMSVALIIQALFFGDGGVTAIGANAFNLAIALPLSGYAVYYVLSRGRPSDRRRTIAAAVGSYIGLNVAGLLVAVELGIQPLFWSEGGRALYNPFGLSATIPAMAITHLTVAGFAEAALTALAVAYLLRRHRSLVVPPAAGAAPGAASRRNASVPAFVIAALIVIVPIGLLASGRAAFEWSGEQVTEMVGYLPAGLAKLAPLWQSAPLASYQATTAGGSFLDRAVDYVLSAAFGVGVIATLLLSLRLVAGRRLASFERAVSGDTHGPPR